MTETARTVLDKFQIRKTKKQKTAFLDFAKQKTEELGYSCIIEKESFGVRNLVVGDVDKAKAVFTAHYDTCPVLPFPNFITPKNFAIYLAYQFAIIFPIFLLEFLIGFVIGFATAFLPDGFPADSVAFLVSYAFLILVLFLLLGGPANKHTANDNTSGVNTLFEIMEQLPEEDRHKAAFVFFDLEESGLIGSSLFASRHKKAMKDKLLINFDCVSDGNNIIFALKKKAKKYAPILEEAFQSNEQYSVEVLSKGVFYPSDQASFNMGVGVAALKKTKKLNILYMDKIHTKHDTVYQDENITFLTQCTVNLLKKL